MACPLFKRFKQRGTSFVSFPSYTQDLNLASPNNPNFNLTHTKFALLNIPEQVRVSNDQTKGVLNFIKDSTGSSGTRFYNFDPTGTIPINYADQLIESLRDYVANYDTALRESRINSNTDFYNIGELSTPIEHIFWKWCRKYNLIDLEPAKHKTDWDKNLPDFDNTNGTGSDYFRKYLWKERDVNYYSCTYTTDSTKLVVTINDIGKFKPNDIVNFSGMTTAELTGQTFTVSTVTVTTGNTTVLDLGGSYSTLLTGSSYVYLVYNRLVQYIGEVQVESKVQTSKRNFTEISIQIPEHAGATPTVLFKTIDNSNYQPDLEMPILPQEQQEEIIGAENLNSPIRTNPQNYPGVFYGYFDTINKTYKCSTGDRIRYSGDYYGVKLSNNIGLNNERYVEKLVDFNSSDIDGVSLDFDRAHYLKMNLPNKYINNFDDFNSTNFGTYPSDFEFNAILWYYQVDDGTGNIQTNLAGLEFLNNPADDFDACDTNNQKITTAQKLVSNGNQDGTAYIYNLNYNIDADNDNLPLNYENTTFNNQVALDLYQNILQTNAQLQENFLYIISGFTNIYQEIFNMKSIIYNQTDIDIIKSQIKNLNDLLILYSTFQFQNSDTALITTDFTGSYPTLQVDVINTRYSDIVDISVNNVFSYNTNNSGLSYSIAVPLTNQLLININNDNNDYTGTAKILLNKDLSNMQEIELDITPSLSASLQKMDVYINYNNGSTTTQQLLLSDIDLPTDLTYYNTLTPTASTYATSYYTNTALNTYAILSGSTTGTTTNFRLTDDIFVVGEYAYVDNFYVISGSSIVDMSGAYYISAYTNETSYNNKAIIKLEVDTTNMSFQSKPKLSQYKGLKINILRVSGVATSTLSDRYVVKKLLL